jgi:RNA polymerase sigma factor (sigma-70 family)
MTTTVTPLSISQDAIYLLNQKDAFESELVSGLKVKEQKSLENLYKLYSGSLMGIIFRIVKIDEVAEDVLQETFLKIWKSIGQYDPAKGRLFTWMARLARNTALDQLRSRSQINTSRNDSLDGVSMEVERKHYVSYNPEVIGVKQLMKVLTIPQRQILDLIYFEGYTQSEVSEELNIPIGTVKTRIRLAILTLRKYF